MEVAVVGKESGKFEKILTSYGFGIDRNNPEFVFSYGGDGAILVSERLYPGVPKITLKKSSLCYKCVFEEDSLEDVIRKIRDKSYTITEYMKLEVSRNGRICPALNEVQVHNEIPTKAVRFNVYVDGALVYENVIGDGIVISTPYGSTAYYKSVGGKAFDEGIGLVLNNPHIYEKSLVVDEYSVIEVEILREAAQLFCDNDYDSMVVLRENDKIAVKKHDSVARFVS